MSRHRCALALFVACALTCKASPPSSINPTEPLSASDTLADVALFRAAVEEGHAALYRYRTRDEVRRHFEEIETGAAKGLTPAGLWGRLSEFSAFVADAHLQIHPSQPTIDRILRENLLPVSIAFHADRCVVVESFTPTVPIGSEVVSIGGYECPRIPDTFGRLISSDGHNITRKRYVVERDFPIILAMLSGFAKQVPIDIRSESRAEPIRVVLDTISLEKKQSLRGKTATTNPPRFAHKLEFVDGDTAVMHVVSFEKERKNRLPAFLEDSFAELRRRQTRNLVIDLRDNSGGRDTYAALLYSFIATEPFRYVEERVANATSYDFLKHTDDRLLNLMIKFVGKKQRADGRWALDEDIDHEQNPRKPAFTGRVVLLLDASAFSTSSEFASIFRSARRGIIVGEESGNAYAGDSGAVVTMVLPHSGIAVNIPLVEYRLAVKPLQALDVGVQPDCAVERQFADRFTGRDSMLHEAVSAAKTGVCKAP